MKKKRLIAYDIDGTLTKEENLEIFKQIQGQEDISVGIVTARRKPYALKFVADNGLKPDFMYNTFAKTLPLLLLRRNDNTEHIYIGDRLKDELSAKVAGWEFVPMTQSQMVLD